MKTNKTAIQNKIEANNSAISFWKSKQDKATLVSEFVKSVVAIEMFEKQNKRLQSALLM